MSTSVTHLNQLRELDRRHTDRIDVRLLWNPRTNGLSVSIADERSGETLAFDVDPADALEAFRHPYAYAGHRVSARALAA